MTKKVTQHRSAITGRFVTGRFASKHKRTTVTERNRKPSTSRRK